MAPFSQDLEPPGNPARFSPFDGETLVAEAANGDPLSVDG
jgi:hypothetical protein